MTDATTTTDGAPARTEAIDADLDRRAYALAARIMARLRGRNLLPMEGGEAQDEFEADDLTAMIRAELAA